MNDLDQEIEPSAEACQSCRRVHTINNTATQIMGRQLSSHQAGIRDVRYLLYLNIDEAGGYCREHLSRSHPARGDDQRVSCTEQTIADHQCREFECILGNGKGSSSTTWHVRYIELELAM